MLGTGHSRPQEGTGCGISQHRSGQAFRSKGTALDLYTLLGPSDNQEVKLMCP